MMVSGIYLTIDGRDYEWAGCPGSVLISQERGIKDGEVRYISGELFYARNSIFGHMEFILGKRVHWVPCQNVDMEWIRRFKAKVMGC